ncbi:hypothetical protein V5F53_14870 [Xanthobacter sp. V4C-4]|uniref:hypothetical protein n=1 Tax=Xanthobacter cornucopiae TaxID=3119924 RepID=UPI00372C9CC1
MILFGGGEARMAHGEVVPDVRHMALHLARSGRFCGWRLIEIELRFIRGLRIAHAFFADLALRDELDALCRVAQRHRRHHPALPATLPPVPRFRFRGGALPRPRVIEFLPEAAAPPAPLPATGD